MCYWLQTQNVGWVSARHQTVLVTFLGFRKPLHSCTEGMCHSSTRPGTSYHVTQFFQAFPRVSTASNKCWGEKAWVRGYRGYRALCLAVPKISSNLTARRLMVIAGHFRLIELQIWQNYDIWSRKSLSINTCCFMLFGKSSKVTTHAQYCQSSCGIRTISLSCLQIGKKCSVHTIPGLSGECGETVTAGSGWLKMHSYIYASWNYPWWWCNDHFIFPLAAFAHFDYCNVKWHHVTWNDVT